MQKLSWHVSVGAVQIHHLCVRNIFVVAGGLSETDDHVSIVGREEKRVNLVRGVGEKITNWRVHLASLR